MLEHYGATDATDLAALIARGAASPDEMLDAALASLERLNPVLNAVVLVQEAVARRTIAQGLPQGRFAVCRF